MCLLTAWNCPFLEERPKQDTGIGETEAGSGLGLKAAGRGSSVPAGHSQASSPMASGVAFPSDTLSVPRSWPGTCSESPWQRWRCWDANPGSASPAFVTSNPATVTAGQIPTGTGPQLDPADGDGSAKAPSRKALLQSGEF